MQSSTKLLIHFQNVFIFSHSCSCMLRVRLPAWTFLNRTLVSLQLCCPGSESFRQSPPWSLFGPLGPQAPVSFPQKVHNAIQTIGQGTKSTFTQVGLSLKAKRHCLEDFQTSLPPQKTDPPLPLHTPPLSSLAFKKKKFTIPVMETWEPNILHPAQYHPPIHKHPQFSQTPSLQDKSPLEAKCMWGLWWIP